MENTVNTFIEKVLAKFADNITDRVFLMVQGDKELMNEYQKLFDKKNASGVDLDTLNSHLGKAIKVRFNLDNIGLCDTPESTLLRTYERHISK